MTSESQRARHATGRHSAEAGFTLLEAIVSLGVMAIVLIGLLGLFEFNSRVARAQVNVAEMQQSLRAAQTSMSREVRMAGRGGLPAFAGAQELPNGVAVAVQNNVPAGTTIDGKSGPEVVAGTDVLTIRGVFAGTLYQLRTGGDGSDTDSKVDDSGTGQIIVRAISPAGVEQDLGPLQKAIENGRPEALLLISSLEDSIQAVVEMTSASQDNDDNVALSYTNTGTHGIDYRALSGGVFPPNLTSVASVGLLEEYRYYVRNEKTGPVLSRARFYPGTNVAYAGDPDNLHQDLADNILDLQVALGIDTNNNETIEDTGSGADDWLFNATADSDSSGNPKDRSLWNDDTHPLYYVRINTLARTDHADPKYVSPPITAIEDHVYGEAATPAAGTGLARAYRRRLLQTVVDLRNVS